MQIMMHHQYLLRESGISTFITIAHHFSLFNARLLNALTFCHQYSFEYNHGSCRSSAGTFRVPNNPFVTITSCPRGNLLRRQQRPAQMEYSSSGRKTFRSGSNGAKNISLQQTRKSGQWYAIYFYFFEPCFCTCVK